MKYSELSKEQQLEIKKIIYSMGYQGEITDEVAEVYANKAFILIAPALIQIFSFLFDGLHNVQQSLIKGNMIPENKKGLRFINFQKKKDSFVYSINQRVELSNQLINKIGL